MAARRRHDSDDSPVAAKLQRFDLSGKALYKNQIIIIIIITLIPSSLVMKLYNCDFILTF